jgi:hypothetical protein
MEESKIVEQLKAQQAPEEIRETPSATEVETIVKESDEIDLATKLKLYSFFELELGQFDDTEIQAKIVDIMKWAQTQKPNADVFDAIYMIKGVDAKIGRTDYPSLDKIWQYVKLANQKEDIDKELKLMEK